MGRFDFQSPGAAAVGGIQDFIRQRNADERQAILDALQQKDLSEKWRHQDADLSLQQGADRRAGEMHTEDLFTKQRGSLAGGTDASTIQNDALVKQLEQRGLLRSNPAATPRVDTETSFEGAEGSQSDPTVTLPQTPANRTYIGDEKYQTEQRQRGYVDEFLGQNPDVAKDPDRLRAILMTKAGLIGDVPDTLVGPPPSVTPISWQGKAQPTVNIPRGGTAMELNPPPSAYFGGSGSPFQYAGTDPATGLPISFNSRTNTFEVRPIQGADTIGAKPTAPKGTPSGLITQLAAAKQDVDKLTTEHEGQFGQSFFNRAKSSDLIGAEGRYNTLVSQVIQSVPGATPGMVDKAVEIVNDPRSNGMSAQMLYDSGSLLKDEWTPVEVQQLDKVLSILRGGIAGQVGR